MFLSLFETRALLQKLTICGCFLILAHPAVACLCEGGSKKKAFDHARRNASVIFVGRALDVHNGATQGEFSGWRVKLSVDRYWKGQAVEEIVVFTGGGCAAYFEVGREYLVFAYIRAGEDHLYTDVCMQTGLVQYQAYDLTRLGLGKNQPLELTGET